MTTGMSEPSFIWTPEGVIIEWPDGRSDTTMIDSDLIDLIVDRINRGIALKRIASRLDHAMIRCEEARTWASGCVDANTGKVIGDDFDNCQDEAMSLVVQAHAEYVEWSATPDARR